MRYCCPECQWSYERQGLHETNTSVSFGWRACHGLTKKKVRRWLSTRANLVKRSLKRERRVRG